MIVQMKLNGGISLVVDGDKAQKFYIDGLTGPILQGASFFTSNEDIVTFMAGYTNDSYYTTIFTETGWIASDRSTDCLESAFSFIDEDIYAENSVF